MTRRLAIPLLALAGLVRPQTGASTGAQTNPAALAARAKRWTTRTIVVATRAQMPQLLPPALARTPLLTPAQPEAFRRAIVSNRRSTSPGLSEAVGSSKTMSRAPRPMAPATEARLDAALAGDGQARAPCRQPRAGAGARGGRR